MTESSTLIANPFIAANPIEFAIYNQEGERVLYIVDNEADAQPLILELKNASPQTIEFLTPNSPQKPKNANGRELGWDSWKAGKELYHLQLRFRPGTLSRQGKHSLSNPILRLAALNLGWDMKFDPDDQDLIDWISFLWVGITKATELDNKLREDLNRDPNLQAGLASVLSLVEEFKKLNGAEPTVTQPGSGSTFRLDGTRAYKALIPNLSADAGGGARGTHIELSYDYLSYVIPDESSRIPPGTRSQFINILNRRGQKYIPLHVGFVGSNTILNDGQTSNELTLRITNISKDKPITFARKSESEVSQFTITVDSDDTDQPWILATKSQAVGIQVRVGRVDNVGKINGYDGPPNDIEIILESPLERAIDTNTRLLVPTEKSAPIRLETLTVRKEASKGSSRISVSQPSMASLSKGDVVYAVLDQSNENKWAVEPPSSNDLHMKWIIKFNHKNPLILAPGESLEFQLLNIITSSPVGYTNLYVNYEDIPGYWDGHFVLPIEKSPLVYRDNKVGIGTDRPNAKLHVAGDLQVNKIGIGIAPEVEQLKVQGNTAIVGNLSATTLSTGNVGIGTQPGSEQLKVQGNTAITGNLQVDGRNNIIPVGAIFPYAGSVAPKGWLFCDGRSYSKSDYPDLFSVIGTIYGNEGNDKFRVPNLGGRFPVGATQNYSLASTGGSETITLSVQQMPIHAHEHSFSIEGVGDHTHPIDSFWPGKGGGTNIALTNEWEAKRKASPTSQGAGSHTHPLNGSISTSGNNSPHENRPPYLSLNFIIKC